jgi:hypothetical protein
MARPRPALQHFPVRLPRTAGPPCFTVAWVSRPMISPPRLGRAVPPTSTQGCGLPWCRLPACRTRCRQGCLRHAGVCVANVPIRAAMVIARSPGTGWGAGLSSEGQAKEDGDPAPPRWRGPLRDPPNGRVDCFAAFAPRNDTGKVTAERAIHRFLELATDPLAFEAWNLAPGTWYLVVGNWSLLLGTCYLAPGTWHLIPRARSNCGVASRAAIPHVAAP